MLSKILKFFIFILLVFLISVGLFLVYNGRSKIVKIENISQESAVNQILPNQEDTEEEVSGSDLKEQKKEATSSKKESEAKKNEESSGEDVLNIKNNLVDFGFEKTEGRKIDTIIIHSSYDALGENPYDVSGLIKEYRQYGVAPHYLIDRDGKIFRLVEEKNIAYHAGEGSVPDGRNGVNKFSLGIEMINTKTDKYTNDQYSALKNLLAEIKNRYTIKYVLGHKDIAPGRKDDPWNFEWNKL